jgi:hypothetical protein
MVIDTRRSTEMQNVIMKTQRVGMNGSERVAHKLWPCVCREGRGKEEDTRRKGGNCKTEYKKKGPEKRVRKGSLRRPRTQPKKERTRKL